MGSNLKSISSFVYKYETNEELQNIIVELDANTQCNRHNKKHLTSDKGIVVRHLTIIEDDEIMNNVTIIPISIINNAFNKE